MEYPGGPGQGAKEEGGGGGIGGKRVFDVPGPAATPSVVVRGLVPLSSPLHHNHGGKQGIQDCCRESERTAVTASCFNSGGRQGSDLREGSRPTAKQSANGGPFLRQCIPPARPSFRPFPPGRDVDSGREAVEEEDVAPWQSPSCGSPKENLPSECCCPLVLVVLVCWCLSTISDLISTYLCSGGSMRTCCPLSSSTVQSRRARTCVASRTTPDFHRGETGLRVFPGDDWVCSL